MLLLILATIVAASLFYYYIIKTYDYWKDRGVKQGNPKWIAGDNWGTLTRKQSLADMVQHAYNQFQGVRYSGIYQFLKPTLVLKDPDLIKQMIVKDFDNFTDHLTIFQDGVDPLLDKNLISLKGQKWRDMRAVLSPSFTSSKMRTMFVLISECAENFVQHFLHKNEDVVTIEFKDTFTRFTNDVIATTAFGIKVDSLGRPKNEFYLMGREMTDFSSLWKNLVFFGYFLIPNLLKFLKVPLIAKEITAFFSQVIMGTIKLREEKKVVRPDMITLLLEARKGTQKQEKEENGVIDTGFSTAQESDIVKPVKSPKDISDMDIAAQAMIFFFAGFETVSSLMCFLAYELTVNVDVQERLREEILSTMKECGGKLTYEALLEMKYMDMVVSEGQVLMLPVYGIHHDPEYYPDPERFDPERFSDENKHNIKPYTYFPFGLGPRNCIGSRFALLEVKTVIFHILRNFELVPVEKSRIPLQISKKQLNMTAEGGFWFGLKRISVRR